MMLTGSCTLAWLPDHSSSARGPGGQLFAITPSLHFSCSLAWRLSNGQCQWNDLSSSPLALRA